MKLKFRGEEAEFLNDIVKNKSFDLLIGTDTNGTEIYEGDIIVNEDGETFVARLEFVAEPIEPEENINTYTLAGDF